MRLYCSCKAKRFVKYFIYHCEMYQHECYQDFHSMVLSEADLIIIVKVQSPKWFGLNREFS